MRCGSIDRDRIADHETGLSARDKRNELGEFFSCADPARRNVAGNARRRSLWGKPVGLHQRLYPFANASGVEIARCHEVDADILRRQRAAKVFANPRTPKRMTVDSRRCGGGSRTVAELKKTISPPLFARMMGTTRRVSRTALISKS
jgi:hypothetical protein